MAFSNSASPEIIWGLGGPEEDHQLHHCCLTGRVGEREADDNQGFNVCCRSSHFGNLRWVQVYHKDKKW